MYKYFLTLICLLIPLTGHPGDTKPTSNNPAGAADAVLTLYNEMNLENKVNKEAFQLAVKGYRKIKGRKKEILTLIDFTKPSTEERLFVFDMQQKELLFSSIVAHGRNSGSNYATSFSNQSGSYKSSLGFYLTDNTYQGKNGYSLILNGLEKGVNDNARQRAIVIHGADYANPSVIRGGGRLGRSLGCPALPRKVNKPIIDAIKGGSVLYIHAQNTDYLTHSAILGTPDKL